MSQQEQGNDAFLWENHSWANLSNDTSDTSDGDKVVVAPEGEEGKGKKRGRGATRKVKGENGEKKGGGETSDHEIHIWTERERRKKMRNMFSNLHTLLPQLPPKADKSTIVDEAVNYIKTLQGTLQRLQKQKLERLKGGQANCLTYKPSVAASSKLAMLSTRETFMADQVSSMNNNNSSNNNSSSNSSVTRTSVNFSASASHLPVIIQTWTSSNVVLNICGNDAQFVIYAPKKSGLFTTICCILEKHKLETVSAHISSDADRSVYMIQARMANGISDQFPELITVEEIYRQAAGEIMLWVSS